MDNKDATREATPATIIVARVNFDPVPPDASAIVDYECCYAMTRSDLGEISKSGPEDRVVGRR